MPRGYRSNNYDFVVDTHFRPFTMQEMLVPFNAYKDTFEKTEAAYLDLSDKADKFSYLANSLDPNSEAAKIYNGYANDLRTQAEDLARNGLSMSNRRALTSLKRRYQGEIGMLDQADTALQKERELRRTLNAKDGSMLYATDNLTIDDFLGNKTPNLYSVSGNDLHTLGMNAGKAASSRIYSAGDEGSTLGGYYRKWTERNGYSADSINAFRNNAAAIPELQQAADAILAERGVDKNLTGDNLQRARQSVINGIIDGAIYKEDSKPVEDRGRISAGQAASLALQRESLDRQAAEHGYTYDKETRRFYYNAKDDPRNAKDAWKYKYDDDGQITGFSEAYEEAVKKGLIKGYNNDGTPKKTPNRKLKEARKYSSGIVSPISKNDKTRYGKKITFAEAVEKDPEIAKHDPGYEEFYEYFDDGIKISVVPISSTTPEIQEDSEDSESSVFDDLHQNNNSHDFY